MGKMNLKRRKKQKYKLLNNLTLILILLIFFIMVIFNIFNKKALPQLLEYSKIEMKKIVSVIVSNTVINEMSNNINTENLVIVPKDSNGNIKSIDFNSSEVNKILYYISNQVEQNLRNLENGNIDKLNLDNSILSNYDNNKLKKGIIYELPSGVIFNNVLLNNILPKIPIKMSLLGSVFSFLHTDVEPYGINSALIKISVKIKAEVKILLPFISTNEKIENNIPIVIKIIEGEVPSYYFDGYSINRTYSN